MTEGCYRVYSYYCARGEIKIVGVPMYYTSIIYVYIIYLLPECLRFYNDNISGINSYSWFIVF